MLATSRIKAWGSPDLWTAEQIMTFLGRAELSRWTRSTYHAHFRDFCGWLVAAGHLDESPMETVRQPARPKSRPRPLSEAEAARVMAESSGRVHDWILLGLLAGLRAGEIAKIRGEDVNPDGIYVEGKGGTITTLPCHPDLWDMAQRYPRYGYWFPGGMDGHLRTNRVSNEVGTLFRSLGIVGSVHRCRHTYGTRLLRSGVNIRVVQKLMRHANLDTTAAYTAVDEDELRAAINGLVA